MRKKIYIAGLICSALFFCISMLQMIPRYTDAKRQKEAFAQLAEIVEQAEEVQETEEISGETKETENQALLKKYQKLYSQNHDMAGWIFIDDPPINYPVMYTPDNPDYYLRHSFEKEYSTCGVPYIAEHCNPIKPSDNVILYGHHMKDGTMFTGLMKYTDREFYVNHKTIRFDILTETATYEILAVFKTTVYDNTSFKYYQFANARTEEEFEAYVNTCKELSLYDTEVTAEYGDRLLTLSTCEYSEENGRLVVVAKKIVE